jgi:hypothetical protein
MKPRKMIAISVDNYYKIKRYGLAGDSINIAVGRLVELADRLRGQVSG